MKDIKKFLRNNGINYKIINHKSIKTCDDARKKGIEIKKIVKCILLKSNKGYILYLTKGDKRIDIKELSGILNIQYIRLAKPQEVEKITGFKVGCIPPFVPNLKIKLDKAILENEFVLITAGNPIESVEIRSSDLNKLVEIISDISDIHAQGL